MYIYIIVTYLSIKSLSIKSPPTIYSLKSLYGSVEILCDNRVSQLVNQ